MIDAQYVHKTVEKHYPGLKELLDNLDNPYEEKERTNIIKMAANEMESLIEEERQRNAAMELEAYISSKEQENKQRIKDNVVQSVQMLTSDYTTDTIMKTCEKVMNLKSSKGLTEQEIGQKVFQRLLEGKNDKRKAGTKKSSGKMDSNHIDMRKYLLEE